LVDELEKDEKKRGAK
jgi:hypothetical protein